MKMKSTTEMPQMQGQISLTPAGAAVQNCFAIIVKAGTAGVILAGFSTTLMLKLDMDISSNLVNLLIIFNIPFTLPVIGLLFDLLPWAQEETGGNNITILPAPPPEETVRLIPTNVSKNMIAIDDNKVATRDLVQFVSEGAIRGWTKRDWIGDENRPARRMVSGPLCDYNYWRTLKDICESRGWITFGTGRTPSLNGFTTEEIMEEINRMSRAIVM